MSKVVIKEEPQQSSFDKIKGLFFMTVCVTLTACLYTIQKMLLLDCASRNNPIHPFEFTYLITLILFVLYGLTFKFLKVDFFPIPKQIRVVYILRCVIGMMCNLTFLLSL